MEKKYQIFVSSTYNDLIDERNEVIKTILELDHIPIGMELFPAADNDSWTYIQQTISQCDYYLLILGGRYGSTDKNGVGFTEKEYRYAIETSIPRIAFMFKDPQNLPGKSLEDTDIGRRKYAEFRKSILDDRKVKYWENKGDLIAGIASSINYLIKTNPRIGWVRADKIEDENLIKELDKVKKEKQELTKLYEGALNQIKQFKQNKVIISPENELKAKIDLNDRIFENINKLIEKSYLILEDAATYTNNITKNNPMYTSIRKFFLSFDNLTFPPFFDICFTLEDFRSYIQKEGGYRIRRDIIRESLNNIRTQLDSIDVLILRKHPYLPMERLNKWLNSDIFISMLEGFEKQDTTNEI